MNQRMLTPPNGSGGASSADKIYFNNDGTDLQSTDVEGAIKEVNSKTSAKTLTSSGDAIKQNISVIKNGKACVISMTAQCSKALAYNTLLGVVNAEVTPSGYFYGFAFKNSDSSVQPIQINPNGNLMWMGANINADDWITLCISYFCK